MKKMMLVVALMLTASGCYSLDEEVLPSEVRRAIRYGAKLKMTLRIVDEKGVPVTNALVSVVYGTYEYQKTVNGFTDINGLHVAEDVSTRNSIGGSVAKDGYYTSFFKFPDIGDLSRILENGRWQPWNPVIPVILRERRNPIPMYAVRLAFERFPSDMGVGYDCEKGDFVEPHGKGKTADFIITMSGGEIPESRRTKRRLRLSASDEGGGFIRKQKMKWCEFVSEHEAPVYGYETDILMADEVERPFYEKNPGDIAEDEYLIFKSRIIRDKEGNIVSANYGKIYGKLEYVFANNVNWDPKNPLSTKSYGGIKCVCFFNPAPNDRNLEFDRTRNLLDPKGRKNVYSSPEF